MPFFASPRPSIVARLLILIIGVYRVTLGTVLGGQCRFFPSCSCYGLLAVKTHGATLGSWLTVRRILCCHPWHPGGFDPVPGARLSGGEP